MEEKDFVTQYFKWIDPDYQKKKAEELANMTRKSEEENDI